MSKNRIGIETEKAQELSEQLNHLLANYQVFYMNTRGFHWNIKGSKFFELHLKFEELYNDLQVKIDEIAERVLTLGHTPLHTYTEYLKHAELKEALNVSSGKMAVEHILNVLSTLLRFKEVYWIYLTKATMKAPMP